MIEGSDVTIIACGHMVWQAIEAEERLAEKGISVELINIPPSAARRRGYPHVGEKTGCVVTCEEHQINGGLGDSVAQVLSRFNPAPVEMVAVNDSFGESGTPTQLLKKYGLGPENIVAAVEKVIQRKHTK